MASKSLLFLVLLAAVVFAAWTYHGEVHNFGNMTVVYSVFQRPAVEIKVDNSVYYVIRHYDPEVKKANKEAQEKIKLWYEFPEKWHEEFKKVWREIEAELEAANYTGTADYYYCCGAVANRTTAERLSRASKWANRTSALIEDVKASLATAGIKVNVIFVSAWRRTVNIDISQPPGKDMSALAKVKDRLREVFKKL
ncbi:MAG: hypothetical protein QW794_01935 [Thermosphaera sp.]